MRKTKKKRSQKDVKQMEGHDPELEKSKYSSVWAQTLELA